LTNEDEKRIEKEIASGELHPMKAKEELAFYITSLYHGKIEAEEARLTFKRLFSHQEIGEEDVPEYLIDKPIGIIDLIYQSGLAPSKNEARRLILQGAVSIDGEKITDLNYIVKKSGILKVGKRRFLRIKLTTSLKLKDED
jgi:tyrosyl-tRNA synthetase